MEEEKLTLKEKIARFKKEQEAAKIKVIQETAPEKKEELPGNAIKNKLLALGLQKQINPPAATKDAGWTPPKPQEVTPEETTAFKAETGVEVKGTVCPTCGKIFKVIAKHRCTGREPKQSDAAMYEQERKEHETVELTTQEKAQFVAEVENDTVSKTSVENAITSVQEIYKHRYMLLIDCVMRSPGRDVVDARVLVAPIAEAVCKRYGVEHWKLIDYAQGIGALEREFAVYFEKTPYAGAIELDSRMLEYPAIVGTLKRFAAKVIQGIR